ncbi:hypothetical protein DSO57_1008549 [Entomophthora muscae]|uniref:Uncharacterized protein n=1 Tax=Entomophthora muscae TaxID=34485 RepID=A0ACC2USP0_9FUNG|nr:hypothetical protein DSO57_1008549 [Entomophthora muscae]
MLYGREALLSDKVGHSSYQTWEENVEAVEAHTKLIWEVYAQAREKAQRVQVVRQSKWNAQNRFRMNPMFKEGDMVWFDHHRLLKTTCAWVAEVDWSFLDKWCISRAQFLVEGNWRGDGLQTGKSSPTILEAV